MGACSVDARDEPAGGPLLFEAVIRPHRSLSRRGLRLLLCSICGLSLLITTLFWSLGAWPVAGFNGAEITLAVLLLRLNARAAREAERILLGASTLAVVRTDANGRHQERRFDPFWLRVVLQDRPGRAPALWLKARNACEEVASRLGEAEKRDLAQALTAALHGWRNPVFDNPQLRSES